MRKLLVWAAAAVMWRTQGWASGEPPADKAVPEPAVAAEDASNEITGIGAEPLEAGDEDKKAEPDVIAAPEVESYVEKGPELNLPPCDDKKLAALVMAKVAEYQGQHPVSGILEKRRQALLLKNLKNFSEVPVDNFTSRQNYNVANRLLMTKINNGLDNDQIRLCKNDGYGKAADIYLLLYPHGLDIRVVIINLVAAEDPKEEFFIIYPSIFNRGY